jgi:outer membrane protein TolC
MHRLLPIAKLLFAPFVLSALCLASVPAHAQISFSSAISLALNSDPKIKAAQANVQKAQASVAATHDAFIPSATARGGYGKSTGVPLSVPEVFTLSSQSLLFSFSQKDDERAAAAGLDAANLALQDARDQVAEDAAITYVNLDNAQRRRAAMAQEYGYASRLVAIVQDRMDAGRDSRIELLQARRTAAQIHLQQLQVEDEVASQTGHLARLMGLPGNSIATISSSIPPPLPIPDGPSEAAIEATASPAIQSAFANANVKQELAFGDRRYRLRPQVSFGATYSRIDTSQTNYTNYYPGFNGKSLNAASIGLQITLPLYDRAHEDLARQSAAEAARSRYEAEDLRNQFLDGRSRLQRTTRQLAARIELAQIDCDLAQQQLEVVLFQLTSEGSSSSAVPITPKDEQNARLQKSARTVDLLSAEFQLNQAEVNLLRQTGQLEVWLKSVPNSSQASESTTPGTNPAKP